MANKHFANIGDVWKHLPLADILKIEQPARFWESHAGSAEYPLTHAPERDHGVFYFFERAFNSAPLKCSAYLSILKEGLRNGELISYPGSPFIAMKLLRDHKTKFVFCDVDPNSLTNIRVAANVLDISLENVTTIHGDGIDYLDRACHELSASEGPDVFAHIDPYLPFDSTNSGGLNAVDLFCALTKRNIKTMLWYGYDSTEARASLFGGLAKAVNANGLQREQNLWCGDILIDSHTLARLPGLTGCGVVGGNLSRASIDICRELGVSLADIYVDAPGGGFRYDEPRLI